MFTGFLYMISVSRFNYRFTPTRLMSLLTFLVVILFVYLGYWQVSRFYEKSEMLKTYASRSQEPPRPLSLFENLPEQYDHIKLVGHYLPIVFFLDNQHIQHQLGFDVISPLEIDAHHVVLVDRGFVPLNKTRAHLPSIKTPVDSTQLSGVAYYPSEKTWVLGPSYEIKDKYSVIIEKIDTEWASHFLHKSVYPFIIRMNANEPFGYQREWVTVSMPPARHMGYAVQWFAMAFVVFFLFIILNVKKR